ncbi:SAM-dependent methyltransferase [Nocardioides jejuensis]|uniref:Class I SAM-dependent methyltransferase n=1 Tax=Nocardioides jejuensis TaxID=2502782 RepID=A0A4R1BWM0_9ACTN|nr:class I SAM-dependent methyltransferase [Nocardioides jejuensis]TCJ22414.1 hypothetical protein EPD65_12790 [Nocardioides jejuensis]
MDDEGIRAVSKAEVILDVLIDERRIFSFWLHRDAASSGRDGHLVEWPATLVPLLQGTARLQIRVHATGEDVFDDDITLGSGEGRIRIETPDGRPLALDKSGRRVQTFDTRSAEHTAPLMRSIDDVLNVLHDLGIDAFIAYGTLLGAVRNGQLIGHDSDADLGYVSRHEHPVDVMRESFHLQREIVARGYPVTRYSGAAFKVDVRESDGSVRGLDVFGGFMLDGKLHLMGEIRTDFKREWITPLGTASLEGFDFAAPANTDKFLAATYGPTWRVPDPAFHFPTPESTHRRFNAWFRGTRDGRNIWDRYYSARRSRAIEPSDTASWVAAEEPDAQHVIDLGCGYGTDVAWFARQGVRATGLDFVRGAYARMADRTAKEGLDAHYLFFNPLELRSALSTAALLARSPGPRVLMSRHMIDSIHARGRRELWRTTAMMTRSGGRLYLQFLAVEGDDGYAASIQARPLRPEVIAAEIAESGGTVVRREVLPVSSKDGAESASRICRMVVAWDR